MINSSGRCQKLRYLSPPKEKKGERSCAFCELHSFIFSCLLGHPFHTFLLSFSFTSSLFCLYIGFFSKERIPLFPFLLILSHTSFLYHNFQARARYCYAKRRYRWTRWPVAQSGSSTIAMELILLIGKRKSAFTGSGRGESMDALFVDLAKPSPSLGIMQPPTLSWWYSAAPFHLQRRFRGLPRRQSYQK